MPRTVIAIQEVAKNKGAELTDVSADQANGMMFDNDGRTVLIVQNGDGVTRTVTAVSVACSHGRTLDVAQAIVTLKRGILGPFDMDQFNQKSGADQGKVYVDFSAGTTSAVKVHARRTTG